MIRTEHIGFIICRYIHSQLAQRNKCSAVAEMGDRFTTIDMGRKLGGCALLREGAGSLCNTMGLGFGPRSRPTFVPNGIMIHPAVWPQQTWAEIWGMCPLFGEGDLGPHLAQWSGPRHTSIPSGILILAAVWPQ